MPLSPTGVLSVGVKRARSSSTSPSRSSTSIAAFLFRRDFRIHDNLAFLSLFEAAVKADLPILPLFFFNPIQADAEKNPYFGASSFQFMCQSLIDLNQNQLHHRLVCLRGSDEECFSALEKHFNVEMLGFNLDITPFARSRDKELSLYCLQHSIKVITNNQDYGLFSPETVKTDAGGNYGVFTPFYNKVMKEYIQKIPPPRPAPSSEALNQHLLQEAASKLRSSGTVKVVDPKDAFVLNPKITDVGGRTVGLKLLQAVKSFVHYGNERDYIAADRTTHWSPHLKFGTISVRECWHAVKAAFGAQHALARQLIWREFYLMLLYHYPELALGQVGSRGAKSSDAKEVAPALNHPFQEKYRDFCWKWEDKHFDAFREGRTGVPLVDASVRCLKETGWCPNRCRMVIANYLVKTLGVDWREGERWYATLAVDYDVANNSGGWLWSSGQGADAQPFFRTFNPFRQSSRYDKECVFIRRWVPELSKVPVGVIHAWEEECTSLEKKKTVYSQLVQETLKVYPAPIVRTRESTLAVIESFKAFNAKTER